MKTKYKKLAKVLLDDYEMYRSGYNKALEDVEQLLSKKFGNLLPLKEIKELAKRKHKTEKYT